jgi:hypothetical protein
MLSCRNNLRRGKILTLGLQFRMPIHCRFKYFGAAAPTLPTREVSVMGSNTCMLEPNGISGESPVL